MKLKSRIYNGTLYVLLCGELDLSELEFMDSTGIGVLIGRYKKMKDRSIPIYICNPSSHAEKIFKMTGLYEIMPKIV